MTDTPFDLQLIDVSKHFDGFDVSRVTLKVPRGGVMGLVGRNGAGKTTLMRMALGSLAPDSGRIERAAKLGAVSAVCPYPLEMTAPDVERMHRLAFPAFDRALFAKACTALDLPLDGKRTIKELSRGMGMKLQLTAAIASGATCLVMDEPTAGLDPIVRDDVLDLLRRWMEPGDRSLLISSHITSDLERICDRIAIIDDGRMLLACDIDEIEGHMGVARLRSAELEEVLDGERAWSGDGRACVLRVGLSWTLLVDDRAAFVREHPGLVCDRATIDDVMTLLVKGEVR
ncbi:ATP-binding cassette domain-containing protein [Paratractidigestivibacter sp.]|uniref:ATP-binding cassette domain-containing protein n=1 Tax=Paratractidigestivibacter sp. TaxID=2847316 RepID=UPI003AB40E0A